MTFTLHNKQSGLSLVELLIAITLSLILIAGAVQIFLSSKQTYTSNSALSRVQENGRFALEFLTRDIRNTGYKGQCLGMPTNHGITDAQWTLDDPIEGWNNLADRSPSHLSETPVTGTDSIRIKFAAGTDELQGNTSNSQTNDTINLLTLGTTTAAKSNVNQGAITLITDALGCDLFINTAATDATSVSKAAGVNWSHAYTYETEVLPLQNATYYIRSNNGRPNSLMRQRLGTNGSNQAAWMDAEELVDGVQDLQILYGVAGVNRQVTDYVPADEVTNWSNVVAVRLQLLVVSNETRMAPAAQIYDRVSGLICDKPAASAGSGSDAGTSSDTESATEDAGEGEGGSETGTESGTPPASATCSSATSIEIPEQRLAQVFTSTIGLRNRLP